MTDSSCISADKINAENGDASEYGGHTRKPKNRHYHPSDVECERWHQDDLSGIYSTNRTPKPWLGLWRVSAMVV